MSITGVPVMPISVPMVLLTLEGVPVVAPSGKERGLPERGAGGIGVKGVDAVVFGGDKDNVVASALDGEVGKVEWLRINLAVHGVAELQSESFRVDVGGRQHGFVGLLTGVIVAVLPSGVVERARRRPV